MARPIHPHPLSTLTASGTGTRNPHAHPHAHATQTQHPEPSAPSTVLGPLAIHQNQQPQFQYLPEYDWTPDSTSLSYLPLFNPTDQPALPLPPVSRPFSSHAPMSQSPFPLPGARMLTNHPDDPPAASAQPSIDSLEEPARTHSVPPPSIRKSSRLRSGERGSDRDSTGDDRDPIEDVPAAVVADASVSRIRRTWASIYEDDVLTSDESVVFLSLRRPNNLLNVDGPP